MTKAEMGPGEAAERARKRRLYALVAGLFLLGLPVGFFMAMLEEGDSGGILDGRLPPWFAILAATIMVVGVTAGAIAWNRQTDELDRRDHLIANAMGANAVAIVYPAWFILWRGELLPEPAHWLPLAIMVLAAAITYGVLKSRRGF